MENKLEIALKYFFTTLVDFIVIANVKFFFIRENEIFMLLNFNVSIRTNSMMIKDYAWEHFHIFCTNLLY